MKKLGLICCIWVFFVNYALGQQITAAEYFFDDDPGVGNATALSITEGTSINETFSISTIGLTEGLHVLHIRAQDTEGVWSLYLRNYFFVNSIESYETPTEYSIVNAEYFFDDDPGVGNGTVLSISNGTSIDEDFSISTAGLSEGLHVLHIRTQDDNGTWSLYDRKYFYIHTNTGYVNPTPYTIVEAEYFFDTDPGVGNGVSLPITSGDSITENFTINTTGLPGGLHVLHIRAKDSNNTWSLYERQYFFIYTNDGYVEPTEYTITEAEYFFDSDPGVGNANTLSVTQGNTINETFSINTAELTEGMHILHIRTKDNNGTWSLYDRKYFYAMQPYSGPTPVQLVEAEYFLNDDPGVGNGTPISITPGITLDETLVIPVECWEPDDYVLHIRIKDENDTWSHYMFDNFTVEEDMVPPTVITQDITVELDTLGNATISTEAIDNDSYDACGILSMTLDITNFNCSQLGENTVTLTVIDNNNNEANNTAIVTVQDVTPPNVITQNITVQLDSNGTAIISEDAVDNGSSDACEPLIFDTDITSFDCSNLGENTVTLTVSDGSGNSSSQTAIVTVIDTIAPTVIASGNISVDADESCNALVTIPDAIISDNCQNNLVWEATGALNTSGSGQIGTLLLPVGITTVTYTNSDDSGNSSLDSISIEVLDITLPSLTTVSDFEVTLSSGCDFTIPDYTDLTSVSDNCGIASISQTPIGNVISGHNTIQEITITATDINGNSNSISFTITLIGNNIYYADVDGDEFGDANNTIISCSIPNGYSENALDCDDNDPTINPNATEIPCNGIDENCNGLADDDIEAPSCLAQDITVELDAETNEASIVFEDIDNGSYDNCGIESIGISPSIFNQSDIGENDVTVTVTDINGNTVTCYIKVTVTESTLSLENHALGSVEFFPNPFYDEVTIKIPKHYPNDKFLVSLLDLTGKKIFDYQFITINNEIKIDNLEKLPQGLYIIKLTDLVTKNHHLLKLIKN